MEISFEERDLAGNDYAIVSTGGKLPHSYEVSTAKFLDIFIALSPSLANLSRQQKQKKRQALNARLYTQCRPGFYAELSENLHFAYAGQPQGHGTQHLWRLFCNDLLQEWLESFINGTALTTRASGGGHYPIEWGGLYLRSEVERKIAIALDQRGILFFANARGRVGLKDTLLSQDQMNGRIEVDFLVGDRGRWLVLEVDGDHHGQMPQAVRDYAKDRALLKHGVPVVRFSTRDCARDTERVVDEVLAILHCL